MKLITAFYDEGPIPLPSALIVQSQWGRDAIDYLKRKEAHAQAFFVRHFRETPLLLETLQGIIRTPVSDPDVPGILTIALRFFRSIQALTTAMTFTSALNRERKVAESTAAYAEGCTTVFEIRAQQTKIQTANNDLSRVGESIGRLTIARNVRHFLIGGPPLNNRAWRFKQPQFVQFFQQHAILGTPESQRFEALIGFAHTLDEAFLNEPSTRSVPALAAVHVGADDRLRRSSSRLVCFRCGLPGHPYFRCDNPSPPAAPMCTKCAVAHWGVTSCPPPGADLVSGQGNGSAR
jgi:hypothetical protein